MFSKNIHNRKYKGTPSTFGCTTTFAFLFKFSPSKQKKKNELRFFLCIFFWFLFCFYIIITCFFFLQVLMAWQKHRRICIFNIRIEESNQIAVKAKGATEPVRTIKKKIFFFTSYMCSDFEEIVCI